MTDYVQLMQLRKIALLRGDESLAAKLLLAAKQLIEAGLVSDDEVKAAAML